MPTHILPSARTAKDSVLSVLRSLNGFYTHDGEVNDQLVEIDSDGKVKPYAVLWWGASPAIIQRMCATPDTRLNIFQIVAVGGDENRCLWVVDKVVGALVGLRLSIPDGTTTPIRQDPDLGGVVRPDRTVNPIRQQCALLFTCRMA